MDSVINHKLRENSLAYKAALSRITNKYSKLQYADEGEDLDLADMGDYAFDSCLKDSKEKMKQLDLKSLSDLRQESLRAQGITGNSQLNFTHQEGEADETRISDISSIQPSMVDFVMNRSNMTQLTVSSLDESQRNVFETDLQPEDQDEELEMSLSSHSSRGTLADCYADMVTRIGRAYHRQQVSDAADSVLRRYRRWRQHANRSFVNDTLNTSMRHNSSKLKRTSGKTVRRDSTETRHFTGSPPRPPLRTLTKLKERQAEQRESPGRGRGLVRTEQQKPILVIDFSGSSEVFKPKEVSLNKTFTVSQLSSPERPPSSYAVSPSRAYYPVAYVNSSPGIRSSLNSFSPRSDGSMHAKERGDIHSSPVRQSPFKQRLMTEPSHSPRAVRHRSMSTSLSSPQRKPTVPLMMVSPQDSRHPFRLQPPSTQLPPASTGRERLRRHLSFDSALPHTRASHLLKKIDEDFVKLYQKFVCQNKSSPFHRAPCRYCGGSSEFRGSSSSSSSSSALAALALSPHRSLLRKRHREFIWENHPQSKRSRDEYWASSPGSERRRREMLSPSLMEWCHGGSSFSPRKHSMSQRLSSQQHSTHPHQETRISRDHHRPAAECPGLAGGSVEGRMSRHFSPKKWW